MGLVASKSVVGLDIEPGYVAAVESRPDAVSVERAACAPLPPGVVRDGEVMDIDTLADVLRKLFAEHKLPRRVRLGVATQRIVMRTVDLPPLKDAKELDSAVRFQAQDHIPMPLDQAVLEHQRVGTVETSDGPRTRVIIVAARRDTIQRLLDVTRKAGLRAHGIDLSAFAMIRALHRGGSTDTTLYISVGGITNLAVGSTCVFTRVIPQGIEAMAGELAERRGLTLEHSHGWLRHVGLVAPIEELDGDEEIMFEARSVLTDGVRRIADEVRNSLDFHSMQAETVAAERAVLAGPAVAIPGFADQLGQDIALPLDIGAVSEARPGSFGGIDAGRLTIAAGLAVQEVAA